MRLRDIPQPIMSLGQPVPQDAPHTLEQYAAPQDYTQFTKDALQAPRPGPSMSGHASTWRTPCCAGMQGYCMSSLG